MNGIMFHHFHDSNHPPSQGSLSSADFSDLIHFVGRSCILNANDFLESSIKGEPFSPELCLTFDDCLKCQIDVAIPVLDSLGIRAFFFVYSSVLTGEIAPLEIFRYYRSTHFEDFADFYCSFQKAIQVSEFGSSVKIQLENFVPETYLSEFPFYSNQEREFRFIRDQILSHQQYTDLMYQMINSDGLKVETIKSKLWMSEDDIKNLHRAGHVIGLHSHSHPTHLAGLSTQEQQHEYQTNKDYLERLLETKILSMSHPCNSYQPSTLQILSDMGIKIGFRANTAQIQNRSSLEIPREDHANIFAKMQATK